MNKEDILLLDSYLSDKELSEDMNKLRCKIALIKKQISAQDIIQEVQKELAEMDKVNDSKSI